MGLAGNLRIAELLDNIIGGNTAAALKSFDALWMDGKDPATLLGELNGLMRDVLMTQVAPKGRSKSAFRRVQRSAARAVCAEHDA